MAQVKATYLGMKIGLKHYRKPRDINGGGGTGEDFTFCLEGEGVMKNTRFTFQALEVGERPHLLRIIP
jgi:hypothetical protein